MTAGLAVVLVLLCAVGALMGFRDAPNAAALPVRYRALTPRGALLLTGAVNTVGALLGIGLITLSVHYFTSPAVRSEIGPLAVGVSCAVTLVWGLLLWWRRLPGSSTHALISALAGSHLAVRLSLHIDVAHTIFDLVRAEVLLSLLLSPLIAWALARLLTAPATRLATRGTTVNVQHRARVALGISASAMAMGHGLQAGQRMGVLWAAVLVGSGSVLAPDALTAEFVGGAFLSALAVGLGTLGGAWRIAWTLTERLVRLDPLRASVAAVIPAGLLFVGSLVFHLPLSSTHTATAAIVGAGQTQTYASVRWPTVLRVVGWWLLTPVACALLGLLGTLALLPLA